MTGTGSIPGGVRKVAIVFPSLLPFGGAERLAMDIAADQISRGYEVDIVLLDEPQDVIGAVPIGCRVIKLNAKRLRAGFLPLTRYLRRQRPDAVLASMWPMTTVMILANLLAGSPSRIIVSDHSPLSIQYAHWGRLTRVLLKQTIKFTYPFAAARIAVSAGVAQDIAQLSNLPNEIFNVIYNPISLSQPTAQEMRRTAAVWERRPTRRILSVGRLKEVKNHRLLIAAFARIIESIDAQLVVLGTGELEVDLRNFIKKIGLCDKVILAGHVEDVASWYHSADLFVLSSDYEGFGNVIVEALAAGLPVVSTDCPFGPSEILDGGRYGRLVPVGDVEGLAAAMISALSEPADVELLKRRAEEISGGHIFEAYSKLFHETSQSQSSR